jgi:hypothetical protein
MTRQTQKGEKVILSFRFQLKAMSVLSDEANRDRVHETLLVDRPIITNIAVCLIVGSAFLFISGEFLRLIIHPRQTI